MKQVCELLSTITHFKEVSYPLHLPWRCAPVVNGQNAIVQKSWCLPKKNANKHVGYKLMTFIKRKKSRLALWAHF